MNHHRLFKSVLALLVSQGLALPAAFAQTALPASPDATPAQAQTPPPEKQVERVEVIGSRIKRIAKEGATAVKSVGKEEMKDSANISASDSLRDSTVASFGVSREQAGSNAAATATIGLRGLGDTRTLVLLNGHRLPKDPSAEAVDLNLIPQIAIERIEVLKDGASALYGSDAIGGVINIVTKKNFTGTEVSSKLSAAQRPGGTAYNVSLLNGQQYERGDLMLVFDYSHTDKILGKDRDATKDGLSAIGATGAWKNGSNWTVQPGCPTDLLIPSTSGTGNRCYFRYNELASVRPSISQITLMSDFNYRLENGMTVYNRNLIVTKDIGWNYAPTPAQLNDLSGGTASEPSATSLAYRFMEAGNRDNHDRERNFSTLVGAKGNISSTWDYDISTGFSRIHREDDGVDGYVNEAILRRLIQNGTYDPLAPAGSRGDISSALTSVFQKSQTDLFTVDAIATGELGELNGETVGVATGASFQNERLTQQTDTDSTNGDVLGSAGSNDGGKREVVSAFVEISIPVTKKFELSLADRFDQFSDFGTSINPKVSAKYTINENYLIRGSLGTGFKAPTLSQLYGTSSDGFVPFIDRKLCASNPAACKTDQYEVLGGGNKDLKEERAVTASLGTVMQPAPIFSISIDGWYTRLSNKVGIDYEDVTQAELNGADLSKYGVVVDRDPSTGAINTITAPNLNLQDEEISGLDVNAEVELMRNFLSHELALENDFSYIFYDKMEGFPGAGKRDRIGEWERPHWRNVTTLALKNDISTYRLSMRAIPGQNVEDRSINRKTSDMTEYDVSAAYKLTSKVEVAGGIKNILNTREPMDVGGGTGGANVISNDLYDINGRKFFVAYTQKF